MSARSLRFGIKVAQMGGSYAQIRDAWLEADRLGFDTGWLHDHLLNQNDVTLPEDEGWTLLTALLVESRRIRGGLMVTANTFRHPAVLAKIATTVDVVSDGRLEVGLGVGWFEQEHHVVARAREFVAAGATHLIFSVPVPYSAAGVRQLWNEVVTPLRA